jgi:hypothetical protein
MNSITHRNFIRLLHARFDGRVRLAMRPLLGALGVAILASTIHADTSVASSAAKPGPRRDRRTWSPTMFRSRR